MFGFQSWALGCRFQLPLLHSAIVPTQSSWVLKVLQVFRVIISTVNITKDRTHALGLFSASCRTISLLWLPFPSSLFSTCSLLCLLLAVILGTFHFLLRMSCVRWLDIISYKKPRKWMRHRFSCTHLDGLGTSVGLDWDQGPPSPK
jgi:hypothetical protein